MVSYYIGLDIGGTKCAVSLASVETDGATVKSIRLLDKTKFATAKLSPEKVLAEFLQKLHNTLREHQLKAEQISCIGISCGGPLDARRGIVMSPPNLPGWDNIAVTDFFELHTGIPTALQNDANACALAEWQFGAGQGTENMIFLTCGTGFGAGLILNGKLYSGTTDMAGEIGHVRLRPGGPVGYGKAGAVEGFCSGAGLAQCGVFAVREAVARGEYPRLLEAANGREENITAKLISDLADLEKDPMCIELYCKFGEHLGESIAMLVDVLNPQKVILGGVYMRAEQRILPSLLKKLKEEALPQATVCCEVLAAKLGEEVGDYAAIAIAATAEKRRAV